MAKSDGSQPPKEPSRPAEPAASDAPRPTRAEAALRGAAGFLLYLGERFRADGCLRLAAGLSYASLLALVPLFAIGLALLAAFPAFRGVRFELREFLFGAIPPHSAQLVSDQFGRFLENAERLTGAGILGLAVTAVLLLANVNGALNAIWRVQGSRPLALRVLVYWTLLTLGPLLVGASLSLSSYAYAVVHETGFEFVRTWLVGASPLLSPLLAAAGFALLYFIVPNRVLRFRHCLTGGLAAALLLEGLKRGFGFYLQQFPAYEAIYGALAALPILLIWMYLAWVTVLIGAEIAAALPEWLATGGAGRQIAFAGERLALALAVLAALRRARAVGRTVKPLELARGLPASPTEIDRTLAQLRRARYVERTGRGRLVLARDLAGVDLDHLLRSLGLGVQPRDDWPPAARQVVERLADLSAELRGRDLESLLAEAEADRLRPRLVRE